MPLFHTTSGRNFTDPSKIQQLLITVPKDRNFTVEQLERYLLDQLIRGEPNAETAMWELVRFYDMTGNHAAPVKFARGLLTLIDDPEKRATLLVSLGCLMERQEDFPAAIAYYREALPLEPARNMTWYFINNNLGYCLNIMGEHTEAERYCRAAIAIDAERHNAYKNLGIARRGQGDYVEAAACFITATERFPRDRRAFDHLLAMIEIYPEIEREILGLQERVEDCRRLVEQARG